MPTILSIDVGMKNLGVCLFKISDNLEYEIECWEVLNLCDDQHFVCGEKNKKGGPCNKNAKFCKTEKYFCKIHAIDYIIRGLRNPADFEFEKAIAHTNRDLAPIETIFLLTAAKTSYMSSSSVREVLINGGDVSSLVPSSVPSKIES